MDTLQSRVQAAKAALRNAAPGIVLTMAQTGLALVMLRIQRDGLIGKQYSATPIPTYWWERRALNAAGQTYIAQNKLGTWGAFRAAQGLPSALVNLTYTGAMMRSLNATAGAASGSIFSASISAADSENTTKVQYNITRYGDFLAPLPSEAATVALYGQTELDKILSFYLGSK